MDNQKTQKNGTLRKVIFAPVPLKYLVIFLVALFLSGLLLLVHDWYYDGKIPQTKFHLSLVRSDIRVFKEIEGRYPNSIAELRQYAEHDEQLFSLKELFIDFKDYPQAHVPESDVLNGKGGYYYDKPTGTVRINLTQPIKHYFPFYFGADRNQIPADW